MSESERSEASEVFGTPSDSRLSSEDAAELEELRRQYDAATQMADEPWMRFNRAQTMLGGLGKFLPTYATGYGTGMQRQQNFEEQDRTSDWAQKADDLGRILDFLYGEDEENP